MKNELLDRGIILPSGEINKDKINLVAGAITQPFAEMVWVTTGGDMETVNRLTDILVTMNIRRRTSRNLSKPTTTVYRRRKSRKDGKQPTPQGFPFPKSPTGTGKILPPMFMTGL